ncbi:hypothetical protein DRE_06661 [Drechslerella stenobrocha 248]|uniref:Mediator of RNA polymerase II transcription subunit 9 n=1 Tax=Drechslerella stenobrocha 248 TaxID=1043628 RepID=W7I6T1_9PEZI|nr:hypothetical protein DRE_06661 [Drechslerella stenobrocha 248]
MPKQENKRGKRSQPNSSLSATAGGQSSRTADELEAIVENTLLKKASESKDAPKMEPAPEPSSLASILAGPAPPTFPPPETFDFIPQTHDLLQRLLPAAEQSPGATANGLAPLEPKDVDAEASRIRLKIQKARAIISEMPDIERTIDEQEEEIKALEAKIKKQKEVLGGVRHLKAVKNAAAALKASK